MKVTINVKRHSERSEGSVPVVGKTVRVIL